VVLLKWGQGHHVLLARDERSYSVHIMYSIAHEANAKYVLLMALYSYLLGFDGSRKNVIFLYIF
jgi:hypothetical protein